MARDRLVVFLTARSTDDWWRTETLDLRR